MQGGAQQGRQPRVHGRAGERRRRCGTRHGQQEADDRADLSTRPDGRIALLGDPHVNLGAFGEIQLFDFGGVIAAAGMGVTLVIGVARNGLALARLESRKPVAVSGSASQVVCIL